jgi:VIT1/CCC1 family predicted Fe2+/Mn2+ transporter
MRSVHTERHTSHRIGWLRASVLGANDGVVSVASLVVGVAAGGASQSTILLTGMAGLVAGAMSMAAGEYVSVQSQADTEAADLLREQAELAADPTHELDELAAIYKGRGLDEALAYQVAEKLMEVDAIGAHARDELGITDTLRARPLQAALASAGAFSVGAVFPIAAVMLAPAAWVSWAATLTTLLVLAVLGAVAASAGGASVPKGAVRVVSWGALAMAITAGVGRLLGTSVA